MARCRVCMADVRWALDPDGARVPLDEHEERDYGPGRYRIVTDGTNPTVAPVAEDSPARTFVDHREICQQPRVI